MGVSAAGDPDVDDMPWRFAIRENGRGPGSYSGPVAMVEEALRLSRGALELERETISRQGVKVRNRKSF
jgi:hypothetical protein